MQKAAYIVATVLTVSWILAFIVFGIKDIRLHYLLLVAAGIVVTRLWVSRKNKSLMKNLRYVFAILLIILWGVSYTYLNITAFYIHIVLAAAIALIICNVIKSKK